ncbi:MAG: hypothetical protein KJ667_07655, partial [Alphaproteobacteria bacterium]|nr:hypothetical protein [Alphaproteobacteria bacterium]
MIRRILAMMILGGGLCAAGLAHAQEAPHARITLIPEQATIAPGETVTVGIRQEMDEGWHTYWVNAGDSGEPMRMQWTLPLGMSAGEPQWPVPQKIITGPLA